MNEDYLEMMREKIDANGWMVQYVHARLDDNETKVIEPSFAYSVGLTALGRPELLVVGVAPEVAAYVINSAICFAPELATAVIESVVRNVENFKTLYQSAPEYEYSLVVREVTRESTLRTALVAKRLYGRDIRLLQIFLPDKNGRFPWHPDCEAGFNGQATLEYISPPPTESETSS